MRVSFEPTRFHLTLLQCAQQLDLCERWQVPHFVEEQRAVIGRLEQAGARGGGPRECAAHVPEQLALDEIHRDRGTIDGDERVVHTRRMAVNCARGELFTGAALAQDEHGRGGGRDADGEPIHLLHGRRIADQLAELLHLLEPPLERGRATRPSGVARRPW